MSLFPNSVQPGRLADEWVIPEAFAGGYDFEHRPLSPFELDAGDAVADEVLEACDALESKIEAHEANIRKRWELRRADVADRIINDATMQTVLLARACADVPPPRTGDDIQPPIDVIYLLKAELEGLGVPVGSEFRWCFVQEGAQGQIYCDCSQLRCQPLHAADLDDATIHMVELTGHTIRLANGHLRIVFLGYCANCSRVHWFEQARPERPGEEDNSVHVQRDEKRRITYINGSAYTDQELMLRRKRW